MALLSHEVISEYLGHIAAVEKVRRRARRRETVQPGLRNTSYDLGLRFLSDERLMREL